MRKSFVLVVLSWSILGLNSGGCAVDLVATRPGEQLELHVKPPAATTDQPGVNQEKRSADAAGEQA